MPKTDCYLLKHYFYFDYTSVTRLVESLAFDMVHVADDCDDGFGHIVVAVFCKTLQATD